MNRNPRCFNLGFLILALSFIPVVARADGAQQIRAAYLHLDAAYSRRDVPAIAGFFTPGFVRRTWNTALNTAQYQAELKDDFDGTASVRVRTNIQSLTVQGDTARAAVARRVDFVLPKPLPGQPPPYFAVKVTREQWQRIQGAWRMTAMDDTPLFETLCLLNERDQGIRQRFIADPKNLALIAQMGQVDAADRARLKQIIRQCGWPGLDLVGTDGEADAFEVVQHSDADPAFQKRCLPLIEAAVKHGQAIPSDVAYLTDRILTGEHKPQIYGTQGKVPIADPAHVDQRRAAVSLEPLAEYQARLKQIYQPKSKP